MLLLMVLAVLVPGISMANQPYLPPAPAMDPWEEVRLLMEISREVEEAREAAQQAQDDEIAPAEEDAPPPEPAEAPAGTQPVPEPWRSLAECESGDWIDGGRAFVEGSARWDWAAPGTHLPPWGTALHHGGLQFAPSTWDWVAGDLGVLDTYPHAYDAPVSVQIMVAEETQRRQGWEAWPVCSGLVGLR